MLKDEQYFSYICGGVSRPLRSWSEFSTRQYIQKAKEIAKRFYIKRKTFCKNLDNFRYVFIYKNQDTLLYTIFHEIFGLGIYIQKAWDFVLRDVFICKKPETLQKARQFALRFYIQKSGHFALRDFSLNFWNWRREDIFICKKQFTLSYISICKKQCTLRYVFRYKNPYTTRYIFICKKQCTLRYVFISKFYRIVLLRNHKRKYNQSDQIKK